MNNVKDPNKTPVGDITARDKAIETFVGQGDKQVAEVSVNYTDSDGNVRQDKVTKEGQLTQEGTITQRSAKSIYKKAQQIKSNHSRSDKFLSIHEEDHIRIFGKDSGKCEKGKYVIDANGKFIKVSE